MVEKINNNQFPEADVVAIPEDVTLESFLARIAAIRDYNQPAGQIVFSSERGDRFLPEVGAEEPMDLRSAHYIMAMKLVVHYSQPNEGNDVGKFDDDRPASGSPGRSEITHHYDIGGGKIIQFSLVAARPRPGSGEVHDVQSLLVTTVDGTQLGQAA